MSLLPDEILYPLLPSFYRQADLSAGEPLRALLAVLERELRLVDANISRSYENWFIETCEDWVVPYIAELLGVSQLPRFGAAGFNQRTYVADILNYRRRKGTASVVSQYARDLTGWPVRLVEYFQLVATCHKLNLSPRPGTIDLRVSSDLRRLGGPFDSVPHTDEVRNIPRHSGRYNLPSVGLFVWRLRSYRIPLTVAASVDMSPRRFTFDPLGRDIPLFNSDRTQVGADPQEADIPMMLTRAVLAEDLRRLLPTPALPLRYLGDDPVAKVFRDGSTTAVLASAMMIADLSSWTVTFPSGITLAIDPELGRLLFSTDATNVKVTCNYGFSSDVGGGPYSRQDAQVLTPAAEFPVSVTTAPGVVSTVATAWTNALARWTGPPVNHTNPVVIEIRDSARYTFPTKLEIPAGMQLVIRAADGQRPALILDGHTAPTEMTPTDYGIHLGNGATLTLDGLLFDRGILRVYAGNDNRLSLRHCTLRPYQPDTGPRYVSVQAAYTGAGTGLALDVSRCITGPLWLPKTNSTLTVTDSVIDSGTVTTPAPPLAIDADSASIVRSTVIGRTSVNQLPLASDSIFTGVVLVAQVQPGCMRFCYVPSAEVGDDVDSISATPPRYRCQPDGALSGIRDIPTRRLIRAQLVPIFTSRLCGQPGYAQLSQSCSDQIRRGASDESEQGVFAELHQPQREANINAGLGEFLRLGYEAGVFFIT